MAQLVITDITIEGKPIRQFRLFTLDQAIFAHHTFQLICPVEAIEGKTGTVFNTSGNWIGAALHVIITPIGCNDKLVFSGVVTQVEAARCSGHAGDVIFSGCSPTILLDNGPHCKTWERKVLKSIVQDVLNYFPLDRMQPKIAPTYRETLSYIVQYKETAWQFINRLAATYGEWLFYNGQRLVLGAPQGDTINMVYGMHLSRFILSMQAQPLNFQLLAYDYMNHEVYKSLAVPVNGIMSGSHWDQHVIEKSRLLFSMQPKQWHNRHITNKKQLDDCIALQAAARSSHMVRCNGSSDMPGIHPGGAIHVKSRNVYNNNDELYGDFTIISVQHVCDGQGHYNNEFVAVPASVKAPPVQPFAEPRCESQSALVTDNYDPKGLGRIRVKFHWMNENEKTPWLRVTTPHAGSGKGLFVMPEIGEEVIVAFEGDHPARPYIIGSVYHGKAKCNFSTEQNDLKVFQSRSGNKILLDDNAGSILIEDKDGNRLKLDGSGAVQVIANERVLLRCGDATIEMKKDGTICLNGKKVAITGESLVDVNGKLITLN
jgi:type VI secretion system secreted protein VgrG